MEYIIISVIDYPCKQFVTIFMSKYEHLGRWRNNVVHLVNNSLKMTIFDTKMRGKISVCDIFVEKHSNNVPKWL